LSFIQAQNDTLVENLIDTDDDTVEVVFDCFLVILFSGDQGEDVADAVDYVLHEDVVFVIFAEEKDVELIDDFEQDGKAAERKDFG
jgi:hypothetical protein